MIISFFSGAFEKRTLRKESLKDYRNLSDVKEEGEEGREVALWREGEDSATPGDCHMYMQCLS